MQIQMVHGIVFRDPNTRELTAYKPGDVIDVTDAEAAQLVAEGSAVYLVEPEAIADPKPKRAVKVV